MSNDFFSEAWHHFRAKNFDPLCIDDSLFKILASWFHRFFQSKILYFYCKFHYIGKRKRKYTGDIRDSRTTTVHMPGHYPSKSRLTSSLFIIVSQNGHLSINSSHSSQTECPQPSTSLICSSSMQIWQYHASFSLSWFIKSSNSFILFLNLKFSLTSSKFCSLNSAEFSSLRCFPTGSGVGMNSNVWPIIRVTA